MYVQVNIFSANSGVRSNTSEVCNIWDKHKQETGFGLLISSFWVQDCGSRFVFYKRVYSLKWSISDVVDSEE